MDMLDFTNYLSDPRFDEFERINIPIIYDYIKNNQVLPFMLTLTDLQDGLIFHYTESRKQIGDFSSMESAHIFFSQFLQHLFCYVLQEINDSLYLEVLLKAILNRHVDSFYYHSHEDIDAITLWIDPHSKETALTRACEQSNAEIVGLLLGNLKKTTRSSKKNLPPEFTYYLAHENDEGFSALNSVWVKEKSAVEVCLFQLAEEYFGNPTTEAFQRFFFQIDIEGRSAFMRAAERNDSELAFLILEKCHELVRVYDEGIIQRLFFHQDRAGESILHKAVQLQPDWLVFFLYQSTEALGATSHKFRDFLLLADKKGATALLYASQQENRKNLAVLFRYAVNNNVALLDTAITLFRHQDNQGYTALMRAAEGGYIDNVKYLLNLWVNMHSVGDILYHKDEIFSGLFLKSRQGNSVLQLAANPGHWQVLSHLLDSLELVSTVNRKLLLQTINYAIDSEDNLLTRLYREEVELMQLAHIQQRLLTPAETEISRIRLALANQLVVCNFRTVVRPTTASWQFIASRDWLERTSDFFSIFCGSRRHSRHRRAIDGQCAFLEKSYQASIPETSAQIYKESLIHLIAVFTQQQSDSLIEVSRIRSTNKPSVREQSELDRFSQAVTQYYDRYGSTILDELKQTTIPGLDLVFVRDAAGILVDSGTHLLLLTQGKRLYSPLLDVAAPVPLVAGINFSELSRWLATYFSSDYTLHPVNLESIVRHYPLVLAELSQPIISDMTLLKRHYEGVRGETLKNLFLFNQKLIDLEKLKDANFVEKYAESLNLRAENFHELFFQLPETEKKGLEKLLTHHAIYPANYAFLSEEENKFLTHYGLKIKHLLQEKADHLDTMHASDILDRVIDTHETLFLQEQHLSAPEKNQIITAFRQLKNSLAFSLAGKQHTQAALQLLLLLLPSGVQAIINKDPMGLVIPVGLIAADTLLRASLMRLIHHPQIMQILDKRLSSTLSNILRQGVERVPIVGSTLAVYGLIKSGETLVATDAQDLNRPYYAHLFINNLATVGLMAAEATVSLPFWPVLALFTVLTADQIVTEGGRLHDVVFHLQDDNNHPLLKFYSKSKLGLGYIGDDIQLIMDQRGLFHHFFRLLTTVQSKQPAADIVAVALPAVRHIDPLVEAHAKTLGCADQSRIETGSPLTYPQTSLCHRPSLVVDNKENYSFELGQEQTFCERRDPFYDAPLHSNFTLWIGTQSPNCELGQEISSDAVAAASGEGVAALLVNTQLKKTNLTNSGNYTLLLPIDPNFVGTFSVKLLKNTSSIASHSLKQALACDKSIAECIKKITVVLAPLYSVLPKDRSIRTQVMITDDELRNITNPFNQGVNAIEYLISKSNNLTIHANQIPQQTFSFVNDNHHLRFDNNSLRSNNNFHVALKNIKQLTLLFSNTTLAGRYTPNREQQLMIHPLQGGDRESGVILDIRLCKLCSISLVKNVSIIVQSLIIQVQGNFSSSILETNSHQKSSHPLYRLLKPMNACIANYNKDKRLNLSFNQTPDDAETGNIDLISTESANKTHSVIFSGNYWLNGQICFSRLLMHKLAHKDWDCHLEINAAWVNESSHFDASDLQKHRFNKISLLTANKTDFKRTHYLFYQTHALPLISGKFTDYQLKASEDGWLLILKHQQSHEETHCFLAENAAEIIIETIRYAIKPASATLFAINTVDNKPLDVSQLIAPLKINKPFSETEIHRLAQHDYQIDTLRLINCSNKNIYFSDQHFPLHYLPSILLFNRNETTVIRTRRAVTAERNREERIIDRAHDYLDHYDRRNKGVHGSKATKKINKQISLPLVSDRTWVLSEQQKPSKPHIKSKSELTPLLSVKNSKKPIRLGAFLQAMTSPDKKKLTQGIQAKNNKFFTEQPALRSPPSSSKHMLPLWVNEYKKPLLSENSARVRITHSYSRSHTKNPSSSMITPMHTDVQSTLFAMNVLTRLATGEKYKPVISSQHAKHKKIASQIEKLNAKTFPYGKNSSKHLSLP